MGQKNITYIITWRTFRVFYFFFCSVEGEGGSPRRGGGGGVGFLLKIPGGGGSRRGRGREGVCGELGNLGSGLNKIFFSGPKRPPR